MTEQWKPIPRLEGYEASDITAVISRIRIELSGPAYPGRAHLVSHLVDTLARLWGQKVKEEAIE